MHEFLFISYAIIHYGIIIIVITIVITIIIIICVIHNIILGLRRSTRLTIGNTYCEKNQQKTDKIEGIQRDDTRQDETRQDKTRQNGGIIHVSMDGSSSVSFFFIPASSQNVIPKYTFDF